MYRCINRLITFIVPLVLVFQLAGTQVLFADDPTHVTITKSTPVYPTYYKSTTPFAVLPPGKTYAVVQTRINKGTNESSGTWLLIKSTPNREWWIHSDDSVRLVTTGVPPGPVSDPESEQLPEAISVRKNEPITPVMPGPGYSVQKDTSLCCCRLDKVALAQTYGTATVSGLRAAGVNVPGSVDNLNELPANIHVPRHVCLEDLRGYEVPDSVCVEDYKIFAKSMAHSANAHQYGSAMSGTNLSQEDMDQIIDMAFEVVSGTILLGETIREKRIYKYQRGSVGGYEGGLASKIFTADAGVIKPSLVGWNQHGNFYGPVFIGTFGLFSQADWNVGGIMQFGAFYNGVGQNFYGLVQGGAGVNIVKGNFYGLGQFGIANFVHQNYYGGFQAGLVNSAGTLGGLGQMGWINTAGRIFFMQVGLYCDAYEAYGIKVGAFLSKGSKVAGFGFGGGNVHDTTSGFLVGLFNLTHDSSNGFDIGVFANYDLGDANGIFISPIFNYADHCRGVQIGLVNYANRMDGLQIGLVNIIRQGGLIFFPGINMGFY